MDPDEYQTLYGNHQCVGPRVLGLNRTSGIATLGSPDQIMDARKDHDAACFRPAECWCRLYASTFNSIRVKPRYVEVADREVNFGWWHPSTTETHGRSPVLRSKSLFPCRGVCRQKNPFRSFSRSIIPLPAVIPCPYLRGSFSHMPSAVRTDVVLPMMDDYMQQVVRGEKSYEFRKYRIAPTVSTTLGPKTYP